MMKGYQTLLNPQEREDQDFATGVREQRFAGRRNRENARELSHTRTGDAGRAVASATLEGGKLAADVALPGAGRAIGAVQAARTIQHERYLGGSGVNAVADEVKNEALGAVGGDAMGFLDSGRDLVRAGAESSRSRTNRKIGSAFETRDAAASDMEATQDLMNSSGRGSKADKRRLKKAHTRHFSAFSSANKYLKGKSDKGKMPLLAAEDPDWD
jgi:hypothetical protein